MRDFIMRHLGRVLAVLGCSTLVTACYGIPYEVYVPVEGKVIDADTSQPVKGVKVNVSVGSGVRGTTGVQAVEPLASPVPAITGKDGCFSVTVEAVGNPDAVMLEIVDIDGEENGAYMPENVIAEYSEGGMIVAEIEQVDR